MIDAYFESVLVPEVNGKQTLSIKKMLVIVTAIN